MPKFFSHINLEHLTTTLRDTLLRFPLSIPLIFGVSGLWFYGVNAVDTLDWLYRGIITGIVMFLLATAVSLIREEMRMSRMMSIVTGVAPLIFGVFFYLSIDGISDGDLDAMTQTAFSLVGFFAALFVAPFLGGLARCRAENPVHFSNYFTQVSWAVLMSIVIGGVLMILGSIAIASVLALFDIASWVNSSDIYANWAIISLSMIAPLYMLTSLPRAGDYTSSTFTQNKFFSFIIRYIATPFICVYFLILYAYSAKVLMNFSDWPRGVISWMVIGFSSFGYSIYILSRAYAEESRMVTVFRRYFPYMVVPQIFMLGYAISLRIMQYDLTINRYLVIVFGIWLSIISLYCILSTKKSLSMIPASLLIAILVISIGPWSVYSLPVARQEAQLIRDLETAGILKNGTIIPLSDKKDISRELSNAIYSGIEYTCDFDDCSSLQKLFPEAYMQADTDARAEWGQNLYMSKKQYTKPLKYQIVNAVTEYIRVERIYGYNDEYNTNNESSFWYDTQNAQYPEGENSYMQSLYIKLPLNITGYSRIIPVYGVNMGLPANGYTADRLRVDIAKNQMIYETSSGNILIPFSLPESLLDGSHPREVLPEEVTFDVSGSGITMRVYLQSFSVPNPQYTGTEKVASSVNGFALIKDKK